MRNWFPRSARISAAILGFLVLVLIGVVAFVHHQGNQRSAQTVVSLPSPPTTHRSSATCDQPTWSPHVTGGRGGRVTVDAGPSSAVVYWMPSLNSKKCHVIVTKLSKAQADSIATGVRDSKSRDGAFSCAMDDGSAAWIFFRYSGDRRLEVVHAELTGCTVVDAPGRGGVGPDWLGADLLRSLHPTGL